MMKSFGFICVILSLAATSPVNGAMAAPVGPGSGLNLQNMDLMVRPQDDFFLYANGTWLRETPIPSDRAKWGIDSLMTEQSLMKQRLLAESARKSRDPAVKKLGALYASFMDVRQISKNGLRALSSELRRIEGVKTAQDLSRLIAHFDLIAVPAPISSYVSPDTKAPGQYAFWVSEDGLGLPDRDYYLSNDPQLAGIRTQYRLHIIEMLGLLGRPQPASDADKIIELETALARIYWTKLNARDPQKTYNPMSLAELQNLSPNINWQAFLQAEALAQPPAKLIVRQPDYLAGLSALFQTKPVDVWKSYLRFRLLSAAAPYLPERFATADFAFNQGCFAASRARQSGGNAPVSWLTD